MMKSNKLKKILATVLAFAMVLAVAQVALVSVFAERSKTPVYKNFTILGDSLCLGFSAEAASMSDMSTYDIEKNATQNVYPHSYPSVFGKMIGLDTDASDDGHTDVYNFGVCAAWSTDMYQLLTDPFYAYTYYCNTFDETTTFVLPEDYVGYRYVVDNVDSPEYDVTDPSTWVVTDYMNMEEYTVPAGTAIHVQYMVDYWGTTYTTVNPIIAEKYMYVSSNCFDGTTLLDVNEDGVADENDYIYYPCELTDYTTMTWSPLTDEETVAEYGKAIRNPSFTKYYYDFVVDTVADSDLVALAIGGNDIYHSMMPYQQNSGNLLGDMLYMITNFLQMDMTFGEVIELFQDPNMLASLAGGLSVEIPEDVATGVLDAASEGESVNIAGLLESLVSMIDVQGLLDYYSSENINAYMADVLANYKVNYEKTIQRILELQPEDGQLVLMGNYNPYGMVNYLQMLAEKNKNGELRKEMDANAKTLTTILDAFLGDPSDYVRLLSLNPIERAKAIAGIKQELVEMVMLLKYSPNLSDERLTDMFEQLSFPIAVLMMGDGLADVYSEMNSFVEEMAEKYDVAYVDISDAPASGKYDPHPTEIGHKWIAERLYETVVPTVEANVSPAGTGRGTLTNKGTTENRLGATQIYRFVPSEGSYVSAVFVDGKLLDKKEYADVYSSGTYAFENLKGQHTLTVQFDNDPLWMPKYTVDVLGSYATKSGAGLYKSGRTVTVNAGEKAGYQFAAWAAVGLELTEEQKNSESITFNMPLNDVSLTAIWQPVGEYPEGQENTLTFESNGGTEFEEITVPEASNIDLTGFVPEREGYVFKGWYDDKDLTIAVDSIKLYHNDTVYAKWVTDAESEEWRDTRNIVASISPYGDGSGTLSSIGLTMVDKHDTKEYRFIASDHSYISAVFVDGLWLNPVLFPEVYSSGTYVFDDVTGDHTIMVQFDLLYATRDRHVVEMKGSYNAYSGGEGIYDAGKKVYINAGERDGYVFAGWTAQGVELEDASAASTSFIMPRNDVVVTANWTPIYNVRFNTNGGTEVARVAFPAGTVLDLLNDYPTEKEGLHFAFWYYDPEFITPVDNGMLTILGNTTLNAKWYGNVTFNTNGGSAIDTVSVDEGATLDLTAYEPTKTGLHFVGWFSDKELTQQITELTMVQDTTVYAKWNGTVSFNTMGGSDIDAVTLFEGETLDLSAYVPTKGSMAFIGWFSDEDRTQAISEVKLSADTTVYAKYAATLTFETNEGSAIEAVTVDEGTVIDLSTYAPTKEGYIFKGWYADKELTQEITSVTMADSCTVYANWEKKEENPDSGLNAATGIASGLALAALAAAAFVCTRKKND